MSMDLNIYVYIYIYIYICHFEIYEEFGLDVNGGPGPYCLCVVFSLSGSVGGAFSRWSIQSVGRQSFGRQSVGRSVV